MRSGPSVEALQVAIYMLTQVVHGLAADGSAALDMEPWLELNHERQMLVVGSLLGMYHGLLLRATEADPTFDAAEWVAAMAARTTLQYMEQEDDD